MKRKIYQSLVEWKNEPRRKPMILEGARQVGKTYILKEFGRNEYENMVYVNCHNNSFTESIFEQNFDMERILRGLSAYSGQTITAGKTLIFFDEVQEVPRCIESLKYFCEDAPEQHVVVAGSLLGILDHKNSSFPVGKVDTKYLYPMTFEEFLWAKGEEITAETIANREWDTMSAISQKLEDLLRQYYYVGGMPEVVRDYVENNDLNAVRKTQLEILSDYDGDFGKHAGDDAPRVRMVWKSLPAQLAKENKKFIYGAVKKGGRARDLEKAVQWLVDAGLTYKVMRCNSPTMPLSMYEDINAFKLYVLDVGLLGAMANMPAKLMLIKNDVFKQAKGSFTEDYVMQQIKSSGRSDIGVYYYSKDNSSLEIDFLVQAGDRVIPVEVKSESNVKAKSLKSFIQEFSDKEMKGLSCSMQDHYDHGWVENIPLYAVGGYFNATK